MPDIQALTSRVRDLSRAVDSWNKWILITMIIAALAAAGLVYVQGRAFQAAKRLADAEASLGAAKEEQFARENSQLQLQIEKERTARVKLEAYAAWRTITDQQEKVIVEKLAPLKGHTLNMFVFTTDPETVGFADRIGETLSRVMQVKSASYPGKFLPKPGLRFSCGKDRKRDFLAIAHALDFAKVEELHTLQDSLQTISPDDELQLIVGGKH